MNKNIGDMSESELKDFIIELQEENSRYERKNQKYKEVIDRAIEYIIEKTTDGNTGEDLGYSDLIEYEYLLDILMEVE